MKPTTLLLILVILMSLLTLNFSKSSNRKGHKNKQLEAPIINQKSSQPQHVTELMVGNLNTMTKDNHPLWRGFSDNRYNKPFMHGVVGPQWTPPVAELDNGFKHIASPMPKPDLTSRIIADELPTTSYSQSSFDMPKRKDVIQIDIPQATIKTVEEHEDPRFEKKRAVSRVHGTLYHGTGSTDPLVVHGLGFRQIEKVKNSKKVHESTSSSPSELATNARKDGVTNALQAERNADRVMEEITNNLGGTPEMILPITVTNTKEKPDFKIQVENNALKNRVEKLRKTSIGVRAAHTPRRMG